MGPKVNWAHVDTSTFQQVGSLNADCAFRFRNWQIFGSISFWNTSLIKYPVTACPLASVFLFRLAFLRFVCVLPSPLFLIHGQSTTTIKFACRCTHQFLQRGKNLDRNGKVRTLHLQNETQNRLFSCGQESHLVRRLELLLYFFVAEPNEGKPALFSARIKAKYHTASTAAEKLTLPLPVSKTKLYVTYDWPTWKMRTYKLVCIQIMKINILYDKTAKY